MAFTIKPYGYDGQLVVNCDACQAQLMPTRPTGALYTPEIFEIDFDELSTAVRAHACPDAERTCCHGLHAAHDVTSIYPGTAPFRCIGPFKTKAEWDA